MISKTSAKACQLIYWLTSYVFFMCFVELCIYQEKKTKIWNIWARPLRSTSFRSKFVKFVVWFNIAARIIHALGIFLFVVIFRLETWEQLFGICVAFIQIVTVYALYTYTKIYMDIIPIGNGLVIFNAKLSSHFNVPLLAEKDGLEIYITFISLCYFGFCIPTIPLAFFYLRLYDSKMMSYTITGLSFFMSRDLGEVLFTAIHIYFGVLNGLFMLMGMFTVGYPNFINGWLELMTSKEDAKASVHQKIELLKIYRAHQVQQNIADQLYSKFAPTVYMFNCLIYTAGCTALILCYEVLNIMTIPLIIALLTFTFFMDFGLRMLGNTQKISKRFADSLNEVSERKGHRPVRKFYKVVANSCRPLCWNNGDFGSAGSGTLVMILDKIIVAGVVNFVLYFRS